MTHRFTLAEGVEAYRMARDEKDTCFKAIVDVAKAEGAGVIATDAAISIVIGIVKISVFGMAGVLTPPM